MTWGMTSMATILQLRLLYFRVIPTLAIFFDQVSDIYYLDVDDIYVLTFFLAYILWQSIWRSFWHSIWHLFWHSIWHLFLHSFCHMFWHSIWQSFWHSLWHVFRPRRAPQHPELAEGMKTTKRRRSCTFVKIIDRTPGAMIYIYICIMYVYISIYI